GAAGQPDRTLARERHARAVPRSDRSVLPAGRTDPDALEGVHRRGGGLECDRWFLRRARSARGRVPVIGRGPDVTFTVDDASVVPFAAVPMLAFRLKAKASTPVQQIHSIALRCQI